MKLTLEEVSRTGKEVVLRLVAFNDSLKPVVLDRRLLVGPNGVVEGAPPWPVSLEPPAPDDKQNLVLINPHCFYGRERTFNLIGDTTFFAYLVKGKAGGFLPNGPSEETQLASAAEPLVLKPAS